MIEASYKLISIFIDPILTFGQSVGMALREYSGNKDLNSFMVLELVNKCVEIKGFEPITNFRLLYRATDSVHQLNYPH